MLTIHADAIRCCTRGIAMTRVPLRTSCRQREVGPKIQSWSTTFTRGTDPRRFFASNVCKSAAHHGSACMPLAFTILVPTNSLPMLRWYRATSPTSTESMPIKPTKKP